MILNKFIAKYRRPRAGFTIIELLITMVILAVISMIVYSTFTSVIASTETTNIASEQLYTQTFMSRHMRENLISAFPGWQAGAVFRPFSTAQDPVTQVMAEPMYLFIGDDDGDTDSLSFSTSAPLSGASSLPGYFKQVTYEIIDASDADVPEFAKNGEESMSGQVLQVTEVPLMSNSDSVGGNVLSGFTQKLVDNAEDLEIATPTWTFPVDGMDILYYDGEEWVDEWDSVEEERLPWAVDVTFIWRPWGEESRRGSEEEDRFRMVISIPGGAGIRNANPAYGRPERQAS